MTKLEIGLEIFYLNLCTYLFSSSSWHLLFLRQIYLCTGSQAADTLVGSTWRSGFKATRLTASTRVEKETESCGLQPKVVAGCGREVQSGEWGAQAKRGGTLFHLPAGGGHPQCGQGGLAG